MLHSLKDTIYFAKVKQDEVWRGKWYVSSMKYVHIFHSGRQDKSHRQCP